MTKFEAESIYKLTHSPEWDVFLSLMREKLVRCHEAMEWEKPENIKTLQGQAAEIKEVFKLAQQADDFLKSP
jgi:hypothetical protein